MEEVLNTTLKMWLFITKILMPLVHQYISRRKVAVMGDRMFSWIVLLSFLLCSMKVPSRSLNSSHQGYSLWVPPKFLHVWWHKKHILSDKNLQYGYGKLPIAAEIVCHTWGNPDVNSFLALEVLLRSIWFLVGTLYQKLYSEAN